jgi:RNA polymerase sigma-70 factor, ECF subfamily
MTALSSVLFEVCDARELGAYARSAPLAEVEATLGAILAAARAAHPAVVLSDPDAVRHLASRLDGERPLLEALSQLRAADLFLAAASATGERQALVTFEADAMHGADGTLARRRFAPDVIEEAKQNIRERLLVGSGESTRPRILDYDGRGELKGWVAVAIVREAIYLAKKEQKTTPLDIDLLTMAEGGGDDPEVAYFKKRYRAEYKESVQAALGELTVRERALLRQQYILGMSVDAIGAIYQVHRATAARWVQAAREELLSKARLELGRRVGLARPEIEQIVRMIESQLEVSLRRILASRATHDGME